MHRSVYGRAVFLLVLAVLFAAYLRLSKTYPENSDEANILLMAGDVAHGNLYLSGWNVSDVPFITTELPEIALLVKLFGLHLDTAHIAAALTYTIVVGIALLLAKGRARSKGDRQDGHRAGGHARAAAWCRRLRDGLLRRPYRHGGPGHAHLAGPRPLLARRGRG